MEAESKSKMKIEVQDQCNTKMHTNCRTPYKTLEFI